MSNLLSFDINFVINMVVNTNNPNVIYLWYPKTIIKTCGKLM
jgi:hypothetical protein